MRAYSGYVFFKVTTMPYAHYTLATNTDVSLDVGHDFEYVYIDFDPVLFARARGEKTYMGTAFAQSLFDRRASASGIATTEATNENAVTLGSFLGPSILLDDKGADWTSDSKMMKLLKKLGSSVTVNRAEELLRPPEFKPTISRKIHGALLLRESFDELKGRAELAIYSGAKMVVRCGDANPRRLIRIFNGLILEAKRSMVHQDQMLPRLSQRAQTRVLRKLSTSYLERVQSEPEVGKQLYDFPKNIGFYMQVEFHESFND